MGKKHTTESNSKQTQRGVMHAAHFKCLNLKAHHLFLMIILVSKGCSHSALFALKKSPRCSHHAQASHFTAVTMGLRGLS